MTDFMSYDEPNFIWKNLNAVTDMGLIIETEIKEVLPSKRYETITILGRNGELHETFDDYDSYDLEIPSITIPFERLSEVKSWLVGKSHLITHNDIDKYRECICSLNNSIPFENEWGVFYTLDVTFRCQPFRKKVNENPVPIKTSSDEYFDYGQETAKPYIELISKGGNINLKLNETELTLANTSKGFLYVDNEKGMAIQNNKIILTKGEWLSAQPKWNKISISNASDIVLYPRSVWL